MRIGYDVTPLGERMSGVGTYTLQLLLGMAEAEPTHEFLLLSNRTGHHAQLAAGPPLRDAWAPFPSRALWMQLALPRRLSSLAPDICHYPNSIAPLRSPCPYVITVHDMTLSTMPGHHPWRKQLLVRPLIPLVARRAARVIAVSEQARREIVRLLRIPAERVSVIYEAPAAIFRPAAAAEQARVRAAYGLDGPFVLYVGTLEPRKNLVRLIQAWHRLRQAGAIEHRLVIVGAAGWQYAPIYSEAARLGAADLIFPGYVPLADLPALYSAADAFAFPSLSEGFGLPVVEAMACGTPVLISDTPALAEVAGPAALRVDPRSVDSIADGLGRLLGDAALHERLRAEGLARAASLSWLRAARETLVVYREVLGESRPAYLPAADAA